MNPERFPWKYCPQMLRVWTLPSVLQPWLEIILHTVHGLRRLLSISKDWRLPGWLLGAATGVLGRGRQFASSWLHGIAIAAMSNLSPLFLSAVFWEAKLGKQNISTKECDLGLLHCKTPLKSSVQTFAISEVLKRNFYPKNPLSSMSPKRAQVSNSSDIISMRPWVPHTLKVTKTEVGFSVCMCLNVGVEGMKDRDCILG